MTARVAKRKPGPAAKPESRFKSVLIKWQPELLELARKEARRNGLTLSAYVRSCVDGDLMASGQPGYALALRGAKWQGA